MLADDEIPIESNTLTKHSRNKWLITILLIIILAVVGLLGYKKYLEYKFNNSVLIKNYRDFHEDLGDHKTQGCRKISKYNMSGFSFDYPECRGEPGVTNKGDTSWITFNKFFNNKILLDIRSYSLSGYSQFIPGHESINLTSGEIAKYFGEGGLYCNIQTQPSGSTKSTACYREYSGFIHLSSSSILSDNQGNAIKSDDGYYGLSTIAKFTKIASNGMIVQILADIGGLLYPDTSMDMIKNNIVSDRLIKRFKARNVDKYQSANIDGLQKLMQTIDIK